jgi:hypothetical protein
VEDGKVFWLALVERMAAILFVPRSVAINDDPSTVKRSHRILVRD